MWLKSRRLQKLTGGGCLERWGIGLVSSVQLLALSSHKEDGVPQLIRRIRRRRRSLVTAFEAYMVYSLARAQRARPGAMAEVGVYEGSTARMICEIKGDVPLHLFDTFSGLPESSRPDRGVHRQKQFACSVESVRAYLEGFPNVHFHQGLFPQSAQNVSDDRFSFVHFDVDLYESTLSCLEYFYPRMIAGGIMLSHDYSILAGVKQAFTEFLADKPEEVIELPTTQCMIVKL
ncbi:MAG: class I SAM-dependent methyltransferase [Pirellulales bacterium]|nr:class I SAM-dependent methyltransferase [Pirellulales bacterium]